MKGFMIVCRFVCFIAAGMMLGREEFVAMIAFMLLGGLFMYSEVKFD